MTRTMMAMVSAIGLAVTAPIGAQQVQAGRIALGLDYAATIDAPGVSGNFLGPTVGGEVANWGLLRLRADIALQFDAWGDPITPDR
jgi:hypothetical protein